MFFAMEVREFKVRAWRRTEHDQLGGRESLRFLVLAFRCSGDDAAADVDSLAGQDRCIRRLLGKDCFC